MHAVCPALPSGPCASHADRPLQSVTAQSQHSHSTVSHTAQSQHSQSHSMLIGPYTSLLFPVPIHVFRPPSTPARTAVRVRAKARGWERGSRARSLCSRLRLRAGDRMLPQFTGSWTRGAGHRWRVRAAPDEVRESKIHFRQSRSNPLPQAFRHKLSAAGSDQNGVLRCRKWA